MGVDEARRQTLRTTVDNIACGIAAHVTDRCDAAVDDSDAARLRVLSAAVDDENIPEERVALER
jgi:hypothetical protein